LGQNTRTIVHDVFAGYHIHNAGLNGDIYHIHDGATILSAGGTDHGLCLAER
jgi:hypothetical protein